MQKNLSRPVRAGAEASPPLGGSEVYELFVAELESRRKRLDRLLRMLTLEANRNVRGSVAAAPRGRCRRAARLA
jgi:hypothetical protein